MRNDYAEEKSKTINPMLERKEKEVKSDTQQKKKESCDKNSVQAV
jgi:hypothetical protein